MSVNIQTIKDIRNYLENELEGLYPLTEISSFSSIIIKTLFSTGKLLSIRNPGQKVTSDESRRIADICHDLKKGQPIQYILGETSFYGCTIKVDKNTLIPRQETEELVDLIIRENRGITGKIIDLGTGSGCIAIALSKNLPGADIYASDNSAAAIRMAENNARINHVSIQFFTHDILKPYTGKIPDVKIIVSNPPYVTESEKKNMHMNILDFEPPGALFVPDNDPLIFYRSILEISQSRLLPYGKVYFEINESKGQEMVSLMKSKGFVDVSIIKDLNGKDRIIKAKLNG
jgi:release factor glutamine methyltransferase